MQIVDTHAHLCDERFREDVEAVLARARAAGVFHVLSIGTTAANSRECIQLASRSSMVSASVGIHPTHILQETANAWSAIEELAAFPGVAAIGETGLDLYWKDTPLDIQEDYFDRHLQLASRTDLPIVIHCRDAAPEVLTMLRSHFDRVGPIRGVMHSFTGDVDTALQCVAMGLHISFAGMLTYKNSASLRETARQVPVNRLLIETDSPYLSPQPVRGKRNEPAYVVHTLRCLAEVHRVTALELAAQLTASSRQLFRLPDRDFPKDAAFGDE